MHLASPEFNLNAISATSACLLPKTILTRPLWSLSLTIHIQIFRYLPWAVMLFTLHHRSRDIKYPYNFRKKATMFLKITIIALLKSDNSFCLASIAFAPCVISQLTGCVYDVKLVPPTIMFIYCFGTSAYIVAVKEYV